MAVQTLNPSAELVGAGTRELEVSGECAVYTVTAEDGETGRKLFVSREREGFPGSSVGKESTCNTEDPGSIPGLGRSPGEGIGYPLHYSWASLVAQLVKSLLQCRRPGFNPWVGKIPRRRER